MDASRFLNLYARVHDGQTAGKSMGKAWVKRWSTLPQGRDGQLGPRPQNQAKKLYRKIDMESASSKSHAIRWLALAAQSEQEVTPHGLKNAGQDMVSMRRCLGQMGVEITDWTLTDSCCQSQQTTTTNPQKGAWRGRFRVSGPMG